MRRLSGKVKLFYSSTTSNINVRLPFVDFAKGVSLLESNVLYRLVQHRGGAELLKVVVKYVITFCSNVKAVRK